MYRDTAGNPLGYFLAEYGLQTLQKVPEFLEGRHPLEVIEIVPAKTV